MTVRDLLRIGASASSLVVLACTATHPDDDDESSAKAAAAAKPAVVAAAEPADAGPQLPVPFRGEPAATRTTESGIVITDYVLGEGPEAAAGWDVAVHYTGYLADGRMFDTSFKRGRPFSFPVGRGRVIKGWDEGVLGMKVGGKRKLEVPAALGYGAKKAGKIPPNSDLIFTMELLSASPPLPDPKGNDAFEGKPLSKNELDGGLVIEDYLEGDGEPAKKGSTVVVHYTGMLKDGTVFDSSVPRKKAIDFVLGSGRVIKGWDLGIEGMKPGGLRKLTIPAKLGYGERDMGKIPPNSQLTFTIELMALR